MKKQFDNNFLPIWYLNKIEKENHKSVKKVLVLLTICLVFVIYQLSINIKESKSLKVDVEKKVKDELVSAKTVDESIEIEPTRKLEELIKKYSELVHLENSRNKILIEGKVFSMDGLIKILREVETMKDIEILEIYPPVEEQKYKLLVQVK